MIVAESVLGERPGRVLPRRAAAEIRAGDQDRSARIARIVQDEVGVRRAVRPPPPVVKQVPTEPCSFDALQKLLGDDLIGVDIPPEEGHHAAPMHAERLHQR